MALNAMSVSFCKLEGHGTDSLVLNGVPSSPDLDVSSSEYRRTCSTPAGTDGDCGSVNDTFASGGVGVLNASQHRVLQASLNSVQRLLRRPSSDVSDDFSSLRQLPRDLPSTGYDGNDAPTPLVANKVSLPSAVGTANMVDLLPPDWSAFYSDAARVLLPSGSAQPSGARPSRAFVHGSHHEYLKLLERMWSAGMVTFIRRPQAVNSVFCVPKGDGDLRLILDARPANDSHVPPPSVRLPTPDVLANLQVDDSRPLYVAGTDVDNFYYRLRLPEWLVPFFAMPGVRPAEVPFFGGLGGSDLVYPALLVLPMGWSHSVFVAQQIHEHIVYSSTSLRREDAISGEADHRVDRVRHSIYIDDVNLFGYDPVVLRKVQDEYMCAMEARGLPIKPSKLKRPTCLPTSVLGLSLDGTDHTFGLDGTKLQSLRARTHGLLSRSRCSGVELSRLVGSWSWCMLARRPTLSVFNNVYRFIRTAGNGLLPLWRSVRVELAVAMALSPFMYANLGARWFPHLLASDASSTGVGVVRSALLPSDVATLSALPVLPATATADDVVPIEMLLQPSVLPSSPAAVVDPSDARARRSRELRDVLVKRSSWSVVASARWQQHEQINVLEARAASTAVRFAISCPSSVSSRLFLLCDSTSVCGALRKGRTSAPLLLRRLRSLQALCLAAHLRIYPVWVPTELNPADAPSRC